MSIPEDHTFRGASYHREGHLDGTLVQSSVAGTCKAEAGPHLRTSHVCGRRWYGRLCSECHSLELRPCVLQCMLICFLVEVGEPAHPLKCSQSAPAPSSASSESPIPPVVTARVYSHPTASQLRRNLGLWPQSAIGQPCTMPDSLPVCCLLLGTPTLAISGRSFAEMPRTPHFLGESPLP